jgi:nucleoside-diphosphate-sugar epimerase
LVLNLGLESRRNRFGAAIVKAVLLFILRSRLHMDVPDRESSLWPPRGLLVVSLAIGAGRRYGSPVELSHYATGRPLRATKLASDLIALEYGDAFGLPIWINRYGVLAGAGQFGRSEQGIFAFWINSYLRRRPLKYIGFDGQGHQVRDCLHPRDVAMLAWKQIQAPGRDVERMQNVSGGVESAVSLAQLSGWCARRFGQNNVEHDVTSRPYDVAWLVLDAARVKRNWDWRPAVSVEQILEEIAAHAEAHPEWLEMSGHA